MILTPHGSTEYDKTFEDKDILLCDEGQKERKKLPDG